MDSPAAGAGRAMCCLFIHFLAFFCLILCRFGNTCVHGGADIKAIGDDSLVCQVHDCSDGTYTLSWHSKSSGRFTLEVLVNGEFLASSPLALHVEPGRLCPSKCTALYQAEDLVAGEAHTVCVVCVDEFGNPVRPSSAEFGVRLRDASGGRPAVPVSSLGIAQREVSRAGSMPGMSFEKGCM